MILPGLPRLSSDKITWSPTQRQDLLGLWQDIARVIGANAAEAELPVTGVPEFQVGSFTPGIAFGGASVGVVYATQVGEYFLTSTAVGSWISCTGTIILTNEGSSSGALTITGLPFNEANLSGSFVPVTLHIENFTSINGTPEGKLAPGGNTIALYQSTNGSATVLNQTDTTNTSVIIFSIFYRVV